MYRRTLAKRKDGSFYLDAEGVEEAGPYNPDEPYGARLVWIDASSYKFVVVGRRDPWWNQRDRREMVLQWVYKAGQYVEVHVAGNTFWLGRIAPDPEGKDYVGSEFARVILDGNTVSERSYKTGMRPLSLLEVLAWASA